MKIAAWTVAAIFTLLLLLVAAVFIGGNTAGGRHAIVDLVSRLTGGQVQLAGLDGRLPSHLMLEKLELRDARGVWLTAEHVVLDWSPWLYLTDRLHIDNLQVARLTMQRLPVSTSTAPSPDPSIPHIDASHIAIAELHLGAELAGAPAALVAGGSVHLRSVRDMTIDATATRVDGDGNYVIHLNFDKKHMQATIDLHEPAGGPLENMLSLPGLGALSATLNLHGARNAEQLELNLTAGALQGSARGTVDLDALAGDLDFNVESSAVQLRPDTQWSRGSFTGRWHGSVKSPTATAQLQLEELRLPGGTQLSALNADVSADQGAAGLQAVVHGLVIPGPSPDLLQADPIKLDASMRLDDLTRPVDLTANHRLFTLRGQVQVGGERKATLDLRLPDVAPFAALGGQQVHGSAVIKGQLQGELTASRFSLNADGVLEQGAQGWAALVGEHPSLKVTGALSGSVLKLDDMKFTGSALSLTAGGSFAPQQWKARWGLELSNLAAVAAALGGSLQATGNLEGPPSSLSAQAKLTTNLSVRGSMPGELTAQLEVSGLPKTPSGSLRAQGSLDDAPLHLDLAIEHAGADQFHAVIHNASWKTARVQGDLFVSTQSGQSRGQLQAAVAQLGDFEHLLGMSIAGSVDANVLLRPDQRRTRLQLQLDGKDLVIAQTKGSVHVNGDGLTDAFVFDAGVQLPELRGKPVSLSTHGTLNLDTRQIDLATATGNYHGQEIHLLAPSRILFANGLSVDVLKLGAQQAELELQGQLAPELALRASIRKIQPALVNVFAPNLLAAGMLEAHAELHGSPGSPTGQISVNATGVRFADEDALGLPAVDAHADAQVRGDSADIDAHLDAGTASQLTVQGRAPLNAQGPIDMQISGKLDVGLLNPLIEARGQHATGQIAVDATVAGSMVTPKIGGTLHLTQGAFRDYPRGVSLADVAAELTGDEGAVQIKNLTATAVPGTLAMTGSIGLLQSGWPVDLKITAKNAQPIVSKLITSNFDADLHVSGKARERIDVAGTVHLNRTLIGIPNGLPPNVAVLDVRRRGKHAVAAPDRPLVVGLDVTVKAPQQILVQGRGLDAEMGGDLHVTGTADAPSVDGGFDLQRGSFSLASSKLSFTDGRISFNGAGLRNTIDPTLDFTAQTTVTSVTAKLHITGVADAPVFEFTSSPELPQDDIMARLLFGEGVDKMTGLQLAQIGAALATLGGVGGDGGLNPLVKLQKTLGLDRLTVGAGTTNATGTENTGASIEAGRYLSRRVYVEARQTTTGTSQLQADVDLTKGLKLQTRLGNGTAGVQGTTPDNDPGSSIGLIYQFEY